MCWTFIRKSCSLWENVEKTRLSWICHKWRHNMALTLCILVKQGYTLARTRSHARAPTHTHTHARTYKDRYKIFIAFPRQQWFAKVPQYYFFRTLRVLFTCEFRCSVFWIELRRHKIVVTFSVPHFRFRLFRMTSLQRIHLCACSERNHERDTRSTTKHSNLFPNLFCIAPPGRLFLWEVDLMRLLKHFRLSECNIL